jgi:hypothetical protein
VSDDPSNAGYVRRIDVLLRADYPNLITRIFEVAREQFVIVFDRAIQDASAIAQHFEGQIRLATVTVTLANDPPTTYLREIEPISDRAVARKHEGIPLRRFELVNLLAARFPDLPEIVGVDHETNLKMRVWLADQVAPELHQQVLEFLEGMSYPVTFQLVVTDATAPGPDQSERPKPDDPLGIVAARLRPGAPPHVRADEDFWFKNVEGLFAGDIAPETVTGGRREDPCCYLDLSIGTQINLRQALLLYEKVYCSLPLAEHHAAFLEAQNLKNDDLGFLAEQGLLKIVTTQQEERLDARCMTMLNERAPHAIIGRRATAAVVIADLARTAKAYKFNDPSLFTALTEYASKTQNVGLDRDAQIRVLLWPLRVQRLGLQTFENRGTKGLPGLGVLSMLGPMVKSRDAPGWAVQALAASEWVHLAHALNATFIPPVDATGVRWELMNGVGDALNFFRSFNTQIAATWASDVDRKLERRPIVPAIPLFEFDHDVRLDEFIAPFSAASTRSAGRSLFARLADMAEDLRADEVAWLRTEVRRRRHGRESERWLSFESVEDATSVAGLGWVPIVAARNIWRRLRETARRWELSDKFMSAIEDTMEKSFHTNRQLDFLSRVDRVGGLLRSGRK